MKREGKNVKILDERVGARVVRSPRVSVVIPAYNCSALIADTLDSALAQTFADYEIILVNDGSPDTEDLERVLERYFDRIIYVKQKNGGASAARNTAIDAARGELLAFLDGDDIWLPEYLASQIGRLDATGDDMIYADAELFGAYHKNRGETFMRRAPSNGKVTTESLLGGKCSVITSGTIARREKVLEAGCFDERLPRIGMEDFDLWYRLAKGGARISYQKKVLLKYRVSPTSLSGDSVQRAERSINVLRTVEEKYAPLTAAENESLQRQARVAAADVEIERGKRNILQGNFADASANFRRANEFYRKFKYAALVLALRLAPRTVLKLFKKMRPAEVAFVEAAPR